MGVLQPWLLALGVGVAIPLLLHLFQRHQGPRVVFPALRYLRRAERESARRVKLRQWLLLLLRVAAILLAALAAAGPFLAGSSGAHEPSAVVIVLDNSLSTSAVVGDQRVFDSLRERALQTLGRAGPDDRFWLLRAASPHDPAVVGDALATAARVRSTEPTAAAADLRGALARAVAILAAGADARSPEVHLLSDLQASELRAVSGDANSPPLLVWAELEPPPANHAITEIGLAGGLAPLAGTRSQLIARVAGVASDAVRLRLFLDDRLAAAATTPPNAAVALSLPARPPGLMAGRVESDADALRADDRRYFVTRVIEPPVVMAPGASSFVTEALGVMAGAGRVRLGGTGAADVVLLSGSHSLPALAPAATLVVLPPSSEIELPALNRQLNRAGVPWTYGPGLSAGEARLASPDTADPLVRAIQQARLSRNYPLLPRPGAVADSVLLRTRDGVPWAVRGALPGGTRYVLLGSPLDPESSTIPTSAAMIPLLDRVIGRWAAASADALEGSIGEELLLPPGATRVLRPDSLAETVTAGRFLVPPVTGIYEVFSADSLLSAFAVNAPPAESDLRRVGSRDLPAMFGGWRLRVASNPDGWGRMVFRARLGLELWRPVLFLLLAVLMVEAVVAATGSGRRLAAGPQTEPMATD